MSWTKPNENTIGYEAGVMLPNNYKIEIATGSASAYVWQPYDCDIWGAMTDCNLSTTRLMQPPFNLRNGDPVMTRLAAINDAGTGTFSSCNLNDVKIRTKPCVPMNFRRDYTNPEDESNTVGNVDGEDLCFKWNTCSSDSTVMFIMYS